MARFHTYSFGNIMLIARQKPTATRVAGIRTWNSLGRFVKRGEKGILILAPMVGRRTGATDEIATEIESDNAADERKPEQQLYGFRAVYVFDVSQTEGKELPSLTDVQGDVTGFRERLIEYVESRESRSATRRRSPPPKACPLASESPCSPECSQPRSSQPSCMKWRTRCCTAANGEP